MAKGKGSRPKRAAPPRPNRNPGYMYSSEEELERSPIKSVQKTVGSPDSSDCPSPPLSQASPVREDNQTIRSLQDFFGPPLEPNNGDAPSQAEVVGTLSDYSLESFSNVGNAQDPTPAVMDVEGSTPAAPPQSDADTPEDIMPVTYFSQSSPSVQLESPSAADLLQAAADEEDAMIAEEKARADADTDRDAEMDEQMAVTLAQSEVAAAAAAAAAAKPKPKPKPDADADAHADAEPAREPEPAEPEPKAEPKTEPEPKPEPKPELFHERQDQLWCGKSALNNLLGRAAVSKDDLIAVATALESGPLGGDVNGDPLIDPVKGNVETVVLQAAVDSMLGDGAFTILKDFADRSALSKMIDEYGGAMARVAGADSCAHFFSVRCEKGVWYDFDSCFNEPKKIDGQTADDVADYVLGLGPTNVFVIGEGRHGASVPDYSKLIMQKALALRQQLFGKHNGKTPGVVVLNMGTEGGYFLADLTGTGTVLLGEHDTVPARAQEGTLLRGVRTKTVRCSTVPCPFQYSHVPCPFQYSHVVDARRQKGGRSRRATSSKCTASTAPSSDTSSCSPRACRTRSSRAATTR